MRIEVRTKDDVEMDRLLEELQVLGANKVDVGDATLVDCTQEGVLPAGFYSTTNLPTKVVVDGAELKIENPEMDCAIVVTDGNRARTVAMHRAKIGDQIVVGTEGVKVELPQHFLANTSFEFMNSDASPEKSKSVLIKHVADRMRAIKGGPGPNKILAVTGPVVVHTGASPGVARLIEAGWIDVIFAGNGFATHDIESNVMGTSLGVSVREGQGTEGGHSNHLRVINEVRRYGSIEAAVKAGYIEAGSMYECVKKNIPFVLAGSLRDDGPLPDVQTDVLQAADSMRYFVPEIGMALMFSTMLHAIATGNILPASVETYCIDINQSVVTKLSDRGSHQANGIVTDVGLFMHALADELID